ncbi:MAG: TVP38/TMEM64 family protein [Bacteroidetes bacterium]|nr:MAG: TVP38/TMEM64 family protein [Bacteroidota bacterium]
MTQVPTPRLRGYAYLLSLLGSIGVPLLLSSLLLLYRDSWTPWVEAAGPWAWLYLSLIATFTMALALTPTTFVALVSGFLLGWQGLAGILLAYPAAALLGRGIGLWLWRGGRQLPLLARPRYQRFLTQLSQDPWRTLIFARLSPVLPFAFSNLLLAQVPIRPWVYVAATMIGMLPRTLVAVFTGMNAREIWSLLSGEASAPGEQLLTGGLLLVSSLGLLWLGQRAWKRSGVIE